MRYTILKWNGEEGQKAVFIIQDNSNGKQAEFTPGRINDIAFVNADLVKQNPSWKDFGEESFDNLEDVIF